MVTLGRLRQPARREVVRQGRSERRWTRAGLIALILSLFGVGLIVLAYMAIFRPGGSLCVTYRLRAARLKPMRRRRPA